MQESIKSSLLIYTHEIDAIAPYYSGKREQAIMEILSNAGAPVDTAGDGYSKDFDWYRFDIDWDAVSASIVCAIRVFWIKAEGREAVAHNSDECNYNTKIDTASGFREATDDLIKHLSVGDVIEATRVYGHSAPQVSQLRVESIIEYCICGHICWGVVGRTVAGGRKLILNELVFVDGEISPLFMTNPDTFRYSFGVVSTESLASV